MSVSIPWKILSDYGFVCLEQKQESDQRPLSLLSSHNLVSCAPLDWESLEQSHLLYHCDDPKKKQYALTFVDERPSHIIKTPLSVPQDILDAETRISSLNKPLSLMRKDKLVSENYTKIFSDLDWRSFHEAKISYGVFLLSSLGIKMQSTCEILEKNRSDKDSVSTLAKIVEKALDSLESREESTFPPENPFSLIEEVRYTTVLEYLYNKEPEKVRSPLDNPISDQEKESMQVVRGRWRQFKKQITPLFNAAYVGSQEPEENFGMIDRKLKSYMGHFRRQSWTPDQTLETLYFPDILLRAVGDFTMSLNQGVRGCVGKDYTSSARGLSQQEYDATHKLMEKVQGLIPLAQEFFAATMEVRSQTIFPALHNTL